MAFGAEPMGIEAFDYQPPTEAMIEQITELREACKVVYRTLMERVPPSAERTLAIRRLEEVSMWGNKAIVYEGRPYLQGG